MLSFIDLQIKSSDYNSNSVKSEEAKWENIKQAGAELCQAQLSGNKAFSAFN